MMRWLLTNMFPPVWVTPIIDSVDDGFMSWQLNAMGEILDIRYMSESKRFWQYGELLGVA